MDNIKRIRRRIILLIIINMNTFMTSCVDVIDAGNMQIDKTKSSLKALSMMTNGSVKYNDGLKNSKYCVFPKESLTLLNADGSCNFHRKDFNTGAILKTYNLTKTTDGTLPIDLQYHNQVLQSGGAIYPTEGCAKEMKDAVEANTLFKDFGEIINNDVKVNMKTMEVELGVIQNISNKLQTDINLETSTLETRRSQLQNQKGLCNIYVSHIPHYKNEINNLKNKIKNRRDAIDRENARIAAEALTRRNSVSNSMGDWHCLSGIATPLRKNVQGDIECMSFNGRDCMWGNCHADINYNKHHTHNPLTCGNNHKKHWGSTGYDSPNHWCNKAANILDSNFHVVRIWQHCNYNGWYIDIPKGRYYLNDLLPRGFRNDDASSIQFLRPGVGKAVLWEHNFSGKRLDTSQNIDCFVWGGFNDIMSSIEIFI